MVLPNGKVESPNKALKRSEYSMTGPTKTSTASWQPSNINECVQPKLSEIKNAIYLFTTDDNFDESLIMVYLDQLLNLTLNLIKPSPNPYSNYVRSIHDVSTIFDSLFYLINAQVNFLLKEF